MNENRKTTIYCATNLVNGKKYIGVTFDLDHRRREHFHRARSSKRTQTKFSHAIRKYGEDSFEFVVLSVWENRELALQEEVRLIAEERPEYNITSGGDGIPILDRSQYPDWYKKVSASLKGRKPSAYAIERWRELAPQYAKRTVVCLNDGFFGRVWEASQKYGVSKGAIYSICAGNWFATKGLFFVNSDVLLSEEECKRLIALKTEHRKSRIGLKSVSKRRPVIRLNDGCCYESVTSAAKANSVSPLRIVQICQGGGRTKGGALFMYADQSEPPKSIRKTAEQLLESKKKVLVALAKGRSTQSKAVVCVDDGRKFVSISDAARHYGKHLASVADAIHRNGRAGGLKFEFCEAA